MDEQLIQIKKRQDELNAEYAKTQAEIAGKKAILEQGINALKSLGCDTVEEAQVKIAELEDSIRIDIEKITSILK